MGVLVAVSIPIFTSQLEKAREATDVANMRAAKAAAVTAYLSDGGFGTKGDAGYNNEAYYDAAKGILVASKPTPAYGKGTSTDGKTVFENYTATTDYTSSVIKVGITGAGSSAENITVTWEK